MATGRAYAWAREIFRTSTELASGTYVRKRVWTQWFAIPMATRARCIPDPYSPGGGIPTVAQMRGLKDFKGDVMHTVDFTNGANWRRRKALVIGTGTSGHDVAQDLHANGCETTIVQRGSTMVVSIDPSAKLVYGIYNGIPIEDGDLLASTNTKPVVKKNLQLLTARMVEADRKTIDGLIARGFKFDDGEDGAGHQWKVRTRYGGYYLDAGCSQLIIDGEIALLPSSDRAFR